MLPFWFIQLSFVFSFFKMQKNIVEWIYSPVFDKDCEKKSWINLLADDLQGLRGGKKSWLSQKDIIQEVRFLAAGEAHKTIFWPTPDLDEEMFDSTGFSVVGTLISASSVPHKGRTIEQKTHNDHHSPIHNFFFTCRCNVLPCFTEVSGVVLRSFTLSRYTFWTEVPSMQPEDSPILLLLTHGA